ncbi:VpsF family polysaccharide biosynthesis protein [Bradyrhizobium sp. LHD-71]|uniref:VpsF family polysaccharide biosynthesis protein n=1 Tax=Bradyrhizobium sp. LHD-71 TaxID=3072141 RepID=UPI0028106E5E|nr:VpsF family polysaccharide biosynthesis protein [Bradyrhizobium sp. LHD-71]MDQ8729772.1 VpsF family polysaccharide biosynthesis protein [Bradyrhizobium sp. LHD-71]
MPASLAASAGRHGSARPRSHSGNSEAALLDLGILAFIGLAILATMTVSPPLLTHWKIQYVSAGGGFYEKLHPATYLVVLALCLAMLRGVNPIQELVRIGLESKAILLYLVCWGFLLVQTFVLDRPFTAVIDTLLLPVLMAVAIWQLPVAARRPLVRLLHLLILVNVTIGYYEYFAGHRIIPLTVGSILVLGEWRSTALLGHPLTASGLVGGYVLAIILKPQLCPQPLLRLPLVAFCLGSLMVFGGRTALVTTLVIIAGVIAFELFRVLRGGRIPLTTVIAAICVIFVGAAAVFWVLDQGVFDKMLLRFSSDKGSALARLATLDMLNHLDWNEIILGPTATRANALQSQLGLAYGVENFWIACIVQFGLVHTVLMTLALAAFFAVLLQRSTPAAYALLALIIVIAASSVSFSSKNIQLTQFVVLITLLLSRSEPSTARSSVRAQPIRSVRAPPLQAGSPP